MPVAVYKPKMETPWGRADFVRDLGQGILAVSTPEHGGIYVPPELLNKIPESRRQYAKRWSRSESWYEEDVAWACVAEAFPHLFTAEQNKAAKATLAAVGV